MLRYLSPMFILIILINLTACGMPVGQIVISEPDEYSRIYESKEKYVLRAIARVFKERDMGKNIRIDNSKNKVDTDYIFQDDWRTKSTARVTRVSWKECEAFLSVTTEKKTEKGWEMRRLLNKEQYETIFDTINLRVYEEMYKTD